MNDEAFWLNKIKAFLHDPPDKLLSIASHEERRDYLLKSVGLKYDIGSVSDVMSSQLQRFIIGDDTVYDFRRNDSDYWPIFIHTITAKQKRYTHIENIVRRRKMNKLLADLLKLEIHALKTLYSEQLDSKKNYFNIWRFFEENIRKVISQEQELGPDVAEDFVNLPADSRFPDHTIWEHLDLASAVLGAISNGPVGLLMFKISPVQPFIAAARKEKDLWAGSHLLSFLSLIALKQVIDMFGPDSVIFPHLRGQPLLDMLLFPKYLQSLSSNKILESVLIANIPNRFLAIIGVSEDKVKTLKTLIKTEITETLKNMVQEALEEMVFRVIDDEDLSKWGTSKDKIVKEAVHSVSNYFNITIEYLAVPVLDTQRVGISPSKSFEILKAFVNDLEIPDDAKRKYLDWLSLMTDISKYKASSLSLYGLLYELLTESVGYLSSVVEKKESPAGFKCTMCGKEVGILGSAKKERIFKDFWREISERNYQIKKNERLCPICLVKRYYPLWFEKNILKKTFTDRLSYESIWFEDIATIALSRSVTYNNKQMKLLNAVMLHPKHKELLTLVVNILQFTKLTKMKQVIPRILREEILPSQFYYMESLSYERFEREWLPDKLKEKDKKELTELLNRARDILSSIYKDIGIKDPPKYYAILVIDGDSIGKALIGDTLKGFVRYLHPMSYEMNKDLITSAIKHAHGETNEEEMKRILNPSTHIAISKALMNFSVSKVPQIVEKYNGITIYSGGDDVLALLPMDTAVKCAIEISDTFRKSFDGWKLLPGLTMSGGILFSHYMNPLFDSLEKARSLEHMAKEKGGRNSLFIGFLKRSGQYTIAGGKWELYKNATFTELISYFLNSGKNQRYYASQQLVYDIVQNVKFVHEDAVEDFILSEFYRHLHPMAKISAEEQRSEIKNIVSGILKLLPLVGEGGFHTMKTGDEEEQVSSGNDEKRITNVQERVANLFLLIKNIVESRTVLGV